MTGATTAQTSGSGSVSVVAIVGVAKIVAVAVTVVVSVVAIATVAIVAAAVIGVCLNVFVFVITAPLGRFIVDWSTDPPSHTVPVTPLNLYLIITTILHAIADLRNKRNRYGN